MAWHQRGDKPLPEPIIEQLTDAYFHLFFLNTGDFCITSPLRGIYSGHQLIPLTKGQKCRAFRLLCPLPWHTYGVISSNFRLREAHVISVWRACVCNLSTEYTLLDTWYATKPYRLHISCVTGILGILLGGIHHIIACNCVRIGCKWYLHLVQYWAILHKNMRHQPLITWYEMCLTHCGMVTPYGVIALGQHWSR